MTAKKVVLGLLTYDSAAWNRLNKVRAELEKKKYDGIINYWEKRKLERIKKRFKEAKERAMAKAK